MDVIVSHLNSLPQPLMYLTVAAVVGLASCFVAGWFLPEQSLALAAGALTGMGVGELEWFCVAVTGGSVMGHLGGWHVGRWLGARFPGFTPRHSSRLWWRYCLQMLDDHVGAAVILGRWSAATRCLVPNAAGLSGVSFRVFAFYSVVGCLLWGPTVVWVGAEFTSAVTMCGMVLAVASAVAIAIMGLFLLTHYRRWVATTTTSVEEDLVDGGVR